ncbi:isoprenylcysteine carboxylmethyltransferase family protein [Candidatus Woesearchaeota archaeon]|nr:isoprenylcysteine carboxylmethyltransferase family protein [Candidatus Woesearchaeota archaeon]
MNKRLINPVIMWSIIIIGIIIINYILPANLYLFRINSLRYLLIPAAIYWIYFFSNAFIVHRQAVKSVAKINKIIDKGVYGIVRHPIYSSDIILGIGIFFFRPTMRMLVIIGWMTIFLLFWMRVEERGLESKFGDEYRRYKKRVNMILPIKKRCKL